MPKELKDFRFIFDNWEDELLNISHDAIECAIASAYMNQEGVDFLDKVAKRLVELSTYGTKTIIKMILSDSFAQTKKEQRQILDAISTLPGVETRIYVGMEFQHRKNYIFKTKNEIRVLVGSINVTSAGFFKNLEIATLSVHDKEDLEAKRIMLEFETMWGKSLSIKKYLEVENMVNKGSKFKIGDNVKYITNEKVGAINKVIEQTRGYSYKVMIDGQVRTIPEQFLEPYIDIEENVVKEFIEGRAGNCHDYKIFHTWFRLTKPLNNNMYSHLSSKTIFNPHQFKPLLRFLSPFSDERLFIADEVGVGKTIETGIILTELRARGQLDDKTPILVVCPNSLGPKWKNEMKERFGLDFHFHDGKTLKYVLKTTLQDDIFPIMYRFSIASLELLRLEDNLELLKKIYEKRVRSLFGMVIVDEAHHMRNNGTFSNELGEVLSKTTEMMLMLSATPLNLKNEDIFNQMHILNPNVFPDWKTFDILQSPAVILNHIRSHISSNALDSKKEIQYKLNELKNLSLGSVILSHTKVQDFIKRLDNPLPFTVEEITKYDKLFVSLNPLYYSFTRSRKREAIEHQVHREALEVPITLSDREMKFQNDLIDTICKYYLDKGGDPATIGFITNTHRRMVSSCIPAVREYLKWCTSENKLQVVDEGSLDIEDDNESENIELDPGLRTEFIRLLKEAEAIEKIDSKYDSFKKVIEKILANPETRQVMVFSFYIRTLEYLKRRLESDGISVGIIHGHIPVIGNGKEPDRYQIMEEFKKGKYQVLLSSEVGGEGLDFQYCHAIVNYDLPYNPMRVEQRIGRIDRFGQQADKIIVGNLFIKGTVDEEIYDRLYRRIRLVEDGVGALEPILGTKIVDLQNTIISGRLTDEQKEEHTRRLQQAIESYKQEMDEFEKHSAELFGDDYLSKQINKLNKSNFIEPSDMIQLTREFLSSMEGCQFKETGEGLGEIVISADVVQLMNEFMSNPKSNTVYGNDKERLLSSKKPINVVFDGNIASDNPNHIFLPPTGFWAQFITNYLEEKHKIYRVFRFGTKTSEVGLPRGKYMIFLYEVRIEGIKKEIDFQGIPIEINKQSIIDGVDFRALPRILGTKNCFEIQTMLEGINPNLLLDVARKYLTAVLDEQRKEVYEENNYIIDSRIAALTKSSEVKVKKMEEEMEKHINNRKSAGKEPDEDYVRMTKSKVDIEKNKLKQQIDNITRHENVSTDYSIEGIVYLEVEE